MFKKLIFILVILVLLTNDTRGKGHRGHRGNRHKWRSPSIHSYPPSLSGLSGSSSPWNKYPSPPGLSGSSGSQYPPSAGLSGSVINKGYPPGRSAPFASTAYPSIGNPIGNGLYPPYSGLTASDKPSYPASSGLSGSRIDPTPNLSGWPNYNSQRYINNNSPTGYGYGPYNNLTPPFH